MRVVTEQTFAYRKRWLRFSKSETATLQRAHEILEKARNYVEPEGIEDQELAGASMRIAEVLDGVLVDETWSPMLGTSST